MKEEDGRRSTLFFLLFVACLIGAGVFLGKYLYRRYPVIFPRRLFSSEPQRSLPVQTSPKENPKPVSASLSTGSNKVDEFGYPLETADKVQILSLLRNRKYKELNDLLESYQKVFESNFRNEYKVYLAFESFAIKDSSIEPMLNEWVQTYPDSFAPYLGRSKYLGAKAWESRGTEYASKTTESQFQGMTQYFLQAEKDIHSAIRLRKNLISAYTSLIHIYKAYGKESEVDRLAQEAVNRIPESFVLRTSYMISLTPRWGGSYADMEAFAIESEKLNAINPRFRVLHGFVYWDRAKHLHEAKKFDEAIIQLNKALEFGPAWLFFQDRGSNFLSLKRFPEALSDFNRALEMYPQEQFTLLQRGETLCILGKIGDALQDFNLAKTLDPAEPNVAVFRKSAAHNVMVAAYNLFQQNQQQLATKKFDQAIQIEPDDSRTYYWRAYTFTKTGQLDAARKDLEKAITLDPRDFESYRLLDWVLFQRRDFDTIIDFWSMYLNLVPTDARAYLERSGTKFHKGDFVGSAEDAQKACNLGNQEGCTRHNQVKSRIK